MGELSSAEEGREQAAEDQDLHPYPRLTLPRFPPHSPPLIAVRGSAEFQFVPLPKTNPILIGHRWKEYHEALGLKNIVDFSWKMVQEEKADMLHVLDFPYNGETRPEHILGDGKITKNEHHL